jgi:hypothetical protein
VEINWIESIAVVGVVIIFVCILWIRRPNGFLKWLFWDFSCFRFILGKITPQPKSITDSDDYVPPSTFLLWAVATYVAFFGVASQRYENRVDVIENRGNAIFSQLAGGIGIKAMTRIPVVQRMLCPSKPYIHSPVSIIKSLFWKQQPYESMVILLKDTVEDWRRQLKGVDLTGADLRKTELWEAHLEEGWLEYVKLQHATLQNANLSGAHMKRADLSDTYARGAKFIGTNLTEANLVKTDFMNSILMETNFHMANLKGADLRNANLEKANLKMANFEQTNLKNIKGSQSTQFCETYTIYQSEMDEKLKNLINQSCPEKLKKPDISFEKWFKRESEKGPK